MSEEGGVEVKLLKPRKPLPDVGEIVVGTVQEVHDYGAYLILDEYGGVRAFLPWSEIASRAVRNIHAVLKPRQKVVVKVIRVYKKRGQVDVSLKRVMDSEKKRKMMFYKRYLKAATLVELIAEKLGKSVDEAYREVLWKLEDAYGDPMKGLEAAVLQGREALEKAGVPEEWIEPLLETAKTHVRVKTVKITFYLTLRSMAGDGVERVRKVLEAAKSQIESFKDSKVVARIYTVGAPKYRVELQGYNYKTLEKALEKMVEAARKTASKLGVEFSFERED
ncbi:translation initiation factor 2 alpha subunit [Aeropyrum pernix K1]|uniref:Translation initiation factor 2 subunit alpha n=1 Tax=Aeropyrum pernix (strain ATCC 700893 / DSM 11879 / JCM 9820 / NBRC 100138 / K1) TaxID=272557 RepID=IF2A_AERPE|nr:translation initiation factor IF-2 subunit alpha [Aeropyrum pernix]Q9YF02.3 RecName: Full=Translation initiation factor 2 subunit alpha; AltName: Full=aIF2-alpha; AltName: Full=eIF-2-alpha [Aeropyrum pernix K1]BAA79394.2 translation initiation factor 2 alpha subunit [Aeropyrum pernix K1]